MNFQLLRKSVQLRVFLKWKCSVVLRAFTFFCALLFPFIVSAQATTYLLGPGDNIAISVYEESDLSFSQIKIGDSGTITYPFLGVTQVAGNSISQVEEAIRQGLIEGEFLIDPEVTVRIVQYRPFYIDGEVNSPGSYPFEPGLTLRKAVSLAGGFTERASRSKITVHSEINPGQGTDGQIDSLDVSIRPGDIITVAQRFF